MTIQRTPNNSDFLLLDTLHFYEFLQRKPVSQTVKICNFCVKFKYSYTTSCHITKPTRLGKLTQL